MVSEEFEAAAGDGAAHEPQPPKGERHCARCIYLRQTPNPAPFSNRDLCAASGWKAYTEWLNDGVQDSVDEKARFGRGEPFLTPPRYYPWCGKLTSIQAVAVANSDPFGVGARELLARKAALRLFANGRLVPVYVLCERENPHHDCDHFRGRKTSDEE